MLKKNYYCLIAGLPELMADDKKIPFALRDFKEGLKIYLSEEDFQLVELFFLYEDNKTLLSLISKKELKESATSNFSSAFIEDQLKEPETLPSYMCEFIEIINSETKKYNVSTENELAWLFYDYLLNVKNDFVRSWFEFDMNIKNLTAGLNCKKYNLDVEREIVGENNFSQAIRTSNVKDFGLSVDYNYVEKVISLLDKDDLIEKERGLDFLKWDFLDEKTTFEYFSIEKVLSFLIKLMIIERWSKLDNESGKKVFHELVERLRASFEFSEEFNV